MSKKLNIIYTRVSTDLQAKEGFSLGAQYKYLTEYCEHNNISNVYHIEDSGISGRKTINRKGYLEMEVLIKKGSVESIIFCKGDRICRNVADHYSLIDLCRQNNVKMVSVLENTEMETADGRFVAGIFMLGAQLESEKISERVKFAYVGMLKDGMYPFGHHNTLGISKDENKILYYNGDVHIVKEIFEMYTKKNYCMQLILDKMKAKYPDRFPWHKYTISHILNNTLYQGYIMYQGVRYELIEPITSPVLISKVGKLRQYHTRVRKNTYKYRAKLFYKGNYVKVTCSTKKVKSTGIKKTYLYYKTGEFAISEIALDKLVFAELKKFKKETNKARKEKYELLEEMLATGEIDLDEFVSIKKKYHANEDIIGLECIEKINIIDKQKVRIKIKDKYLRAETVIEGF